MAISTNSLLASLTYPILVVLAIVLPVLLYKILGLPDFIAALTASIGVVVFSFLALRDSTARLGSNGARLLLVGWGLVYAVFTLYCGVVSIFNGEKMSFGAVLLLAAVVFLAYIVFFVSLILLFVYAVRSSRVGGARVEANAHLLLGVPKSISYLALAALCAPVAVVLTAL